MNNEDNARIYIEKFLKDFGNKSTVYTAIVEAVTNSIESIIARRESDATVQEDTINIQINRVSSLLKGENRNEEIESIRISDNGIGFTNENRDSFSTLYSAYKQKRGGKGLGRMFFVKHFNRVEVRSTFRDTDGKKKSRKFVLGRQYKIIESEKVVDENENMPTGAEILLSHRIGKTKTFNDSLEVFSHKILEKILNFFTEDNFDCPKINVIEDENKIVLNDLIGKTSASEISVIDKGSVKIKRNSTEENFGYIAFKIRNIRNQVSKILLTANNKVVTETKLDTFIPEFAESFIENVEGAEQKFIVRYYVFGDYLNKNVNGERSEFYFENDSNLLYKIGRKDIEKEIAEKAKEKMKGEVRTRFEEKKKDFQNYAKEHIWYKPYLNDVDYESIKINPNSDEIENELHMAKYRVDKRRQEEVNELLKKSNELTPEVSAKIEEASSKLTESDKSNLAQYVIYRKTILEIFKKALEWKDTDDQKYNTEQTLHNIIFPTKKDSTNTSYDNHNLWIIDESLNYTEFLSSDKSAFKGSKDRPDIAAFHYPIAYREGDEVSNPISIFEFKKQGRTDFINGKDEDPVEQIIRYARQFKKEGAKNHRGIDINIDDNTPFYGYIIAGGDKCIKDWLVEVKNMKPTPDGEGWFYYHESLNLYIEYITWAKLLKDAKIRNATFFKKLNII